METQKSSNILGLYRDILGCYGGYIGDILGLEPYKDYRPSKRGLYGFPCWFGGVYLLHEATKAQGGIMQGSSTIHMIYDLNS